MVDLLHASPEQAHILEAQLDPILKGVLRSFIQEKSGQLRPPDPFRPFHMLFWKDGATNVAVSVQVRPRLEVDVLSLAATIRDSSANLLAENKTKIPAPNDANDYPKLIDEFVTTVKNIPG